jgi:hypothetical protein
MIIEEVDIENIKPYKNNPREIPMESVQKVMNSIREFGNNQPIVVDNDNVIVVGHTRWKALKQLGEKKAFIIKKNFTKNNAMAYRIMDNRSGEESKWDNKLLANELNILKDETFNLDLTGFNLTELENLANDKELKFKGSDKLDTDFNVDYPADMEVSHVKMIQLFLNTETEKNFRLWVSELQKKLGTDNLTDTVYKIVNDAYNQSNT